MIILPDEPTKEMLEQIGDNFRLDTNLGVEYAKNRYQRLVDAAASPWTKIDGPDTLPVEHLDVFIVVNGKVREAFFVFDHNPLSVNWMCDAGGDHGYIDLSYLTKHHPTHWMYPILPEPPKEDI